MIHAPIFQALACLLVLASGQEPDAITWEAAAADASVKHGTITVPEDASAPGGRRIELPVRVFEATGGGDPPLFFLGDGPGSSNLREELPAWMRAERRVVLVGYRGVDGSVSLDCPEVTRALTGVESPLSRLSVERLGEAYRQAYERLEGEGIDVAQYSILDVIEDLESVRAALGVPQVDLYSEGYGTRIAYLYGLSHPERIRRSLMVGANPPGRFVREPEVVDEVVAAYARLWAADADLSARIPDLYATMQEVMQSLPSNWMFSRIDPGKVRCMTFLMLHENASAAQAVDAFVQAREGDLAGLALMCSEFDRTVGESANWGDWMAKAIRADYEPHRNYWRQMMPATALIGSPFSQLLEVVRQGGWPLDPLPEEYRRPRASAIETLMVHGSLDVSQPARHARDELLPVLEKGHLVVLENMGHVADVVSLQPDAFAHLARTFLNDGSVDDSRFEPHAVDFRPDETLVDLAHERTRRLLYLGGAAVGLLFLLRWLYVSWRAHSIQRAAAARLSTTSASGS